MKSSLARLTVPRRLWSIFAILLLCATIAAPATVQADTSAPSVNSHWLVVTGNEASVDLPSVYYDALYTIDTDTNTVYGPFLENELTPFDDGGTPKGGFLLDVVITPDGLTALVSSFNSSKIHFIGLADPQNPQYLTSLTLPFYAEDIALTRDGRYALVTDGGSTTVAVIDVKKRAQVSLLDMTDLFTDAETGNPYSGYANAVAVAPNGTVLLADFLNGNIHTATLAQDGTLTYSATYQYAISKAGVVTTDPEADPGTIYQPFAPVNVSVAPDGVTVLVSDCRNYAMDFSASQFTNQYTLGVYKITAPGLLEFTGAIPGLTHVMQTITFNTDGSQAAMLGNSAGGFDKNASPSMDLYANDRLFVMDILGPGVVDFDPTRSVDLQRVTAGQFFGVDGLTVYHGKAYATYPIPDIDSVLYPERYISVVDLDTLSLTQIDWGPAKTHMPIGIAGIPDRRIFLPMMAK